MAEKKRKGLGFTGERVMDISVLLERVLKKNHIDENMYFNTISEHFEEIVGQAYTDAEGRIFGLEKRTFLAKKSYY